MNPSAWRLVAAASVVLGVVSAGCAQQSVAPERASQTSSGVTDDRRSKEADNLRLAKIQVYTVLLSKSSKTCVVETDGICTIEMEIITVDGNDYCLAVAPDLKVKTQAGGSANKKNIVWRLSHSDLKGKALAFHGDSGIVLTRNEKAQVEKGGPGSGTVISPPNAYHVKTKRDESGAVAVYLPVILWGPNGSEDLCAAIDPKIVNVN